MISETDHKQGMINLTKLFKMAFKSLNYPKNKIEPVPKAVKNGLVMVEEWSKICVERPKIYMYDKKWPSSSPSEI